MVLTRSLPSTALVGRRDASALGRRSPGMGSTSTRPGHGFTTRGEQREVLAQRVTLELGRQVEVAQRSGGRRSRRRTSPSTRARASRRPGTPAPTTPTSGACLVDVGLERDAPVPAGRLDVGEHLEAAVGAGGTEGHLGRAAPARTCRCRRRRRPRLGAGIQSMPETNERKSQSRSTAATSAARRHASGRTRTTSVPNASACSITRVAERGLEAREQGLDLRVDRRLRLGSGASGSVGVGLGGRLRSVRGVVGGPRPARRRPSSYGCAGTSRLTDHDRLAAPALAPARRCRCPRSGSAPGASRWPGAAPRAAAGSRGRRCRPG